MIINKLNDDADFQALDLMVGDSQEEKWLPQPRLSQVFDMKPDGFVCHKNLIHVKRVGDRTRHRPGNVRLLSAIRSFVHGKKSGALTMRTLAETLGYGEVMRPYARIFHVSPSPQRSVGFLVLTQFS